MARRLSRLPVAWSDDVVTDAQPPSCQDKPHQIKPNRTEPNRTEPNKGCSSRHWGPAINLEILR
jgi:type IV pilus biogenesis protein CpaD/CtpE